MPEVGGVAMNRGNQIARERGAPPPVAPPPVAPPAASVPQQSATLDAGSWESIDGFPLHPEYIIPGEVDKNFYLRSPDDPDDHDRNFWWDQFDGGAETPLYMAPAMRDSFLKMLSKRHKKLKNAYIQGVKNVARGVDSDGSRAGDPDFRPLDLDEYEVKNLIRQELMLLKVGAISEKDTVAAALGLEGRYSEVLNELVPDNWLTREWFGDQVSGVESQNLVPIWQLHRSELLYNRPPSKSLEAPGLQTQQTPEQTANTLLDQAIGKSSTPATPPLVQPSTQPPVQRPTVEEALSAYLNALDPDLAAKITPEKQRYLKQALGAEGLRQMTREIQSVRQDTPIVGLPEDFGPGSFSAATRSQQAPGTPIDPSQSPPSTPTLTPPLTPQTRADAELTDALAAVREAVAQQSGITLPPEVPGDRGPRRYFRDPINRREVGFDGKTRRVSTGDPDVDFEPDVAQLRLDLGEENVAQDMRLMAQNEKKLRQAVAVWYDYGLDDQSRFVDPGSEPIFYNPDPRPIDQIRKEGIKSYYGYTDDQLKILYGGNKKKIDEIRQEYKIPQVGDVAADSRPGGATALYPYRLDKNGRPVIALRKMSPSEQERAKRFLFAPETDPSKDRMVQPPRYRWTQTPSGQMLVETGTLRPVGDPFSDWGNLERVSADGATEVIENLDPVSYRQGFWNNFGGGLSSGYKFMTGVEPNTKNHFSKSVFSLAFPSRWQQYNDYMDAQRVNMSGRIAGLAGALAGDLSRFGTISALLWRSNPMDVMDSHVIPKAVAKAGVDPQDHGTFKRYAIPLGLVAAPVFHVASGNLNPTKLFNTEEGPRVDGFRAAYSDYENQTDTQNYPLALYQQLIPGNSNFLLPWEEFRKERPDISYDQYKQYQKYLWGEGDSGLQILGGAIKGTNRSLENPNAEEQPWNPMSYEARVGGYRITPLGLAAGAGTLALGAGLIGRLTRAQRRRALETQGLTPDVIDRIMAGGNSSYGYTVPNTATGDVV